MFLYIAAYEEVLGGLEQMSTAFTKSGIATSLDGSRDHLRESCDIGIS